MAYRETKKFARDLSDELGGESSAELGRDVNKLRVLLDDSLRDLLFQWGYALGGPALGARRGEDDAIAYERLQREWRACTEMYNQLVELIGARIRELLTAEK